VKHHTPTFSGDVKTSHPHIFWTRENITRLPLEQQGDKYNSWVLRLVVPTFSGNVKTSLPHIFWTPENITLPDFLET
jgi:hypothetical protein